jgi:hypothetical protein
MRDGCELRVACVTAVLVCSSCLFQAACLAYALDHHIEHGIWAAEPPASGSAQRSSLTASTTSSAYRQWVVACQDS